MKKSFKIGLIVILSIIAVSLVGILWAGIVGGGRLRNFELSRNVVFEEDYKMSEIEKFEISVPCGDVRFLESDDSKIHVEISSERKDKVSVNLNNKKLKIFLPKTRIHFFKFRPEKDGVMIFLPSSFSGEIFAVLNLGDFSADDIKYASVNIEADLGNVTIGKIKDAKIESHLGSVRIGEVLNYLDLKSSLGDVNIESLSLNKDSRIESSLGDVRIKKANDVYIEVDVALGDKRVRQNSGDSNVTLRIDSALGDVLVN